MPSPRLGAQHGSGADSLSFVTETTLLVCRQQSQGYSIVSDGDDWVALVIGVGRSSAGGPIYPCNCEVPNSETSIALSAGDGEG